MATTMQDESARPARRGGVGLTRVGQVISALVGAFLLFDGVTHVLQVAPVVQAMHTLGFPIQTAAGLGVLELACLALYAFPRTKVLGGILLTGYLGGAVAAQVRIEAPLFSTLLFPVYTGVLMWAGLYLRDAKLRELLPLRRP